MLSRENIEFLHQAIDIIEQISDRQYTYNNQKYFKSGVGKHIRHILDFYDSFLTSSNGRIDYDDRQRVEDVESNRLAAISKINSIIKGLEKLSSVNKPVQVKNDDTASTDAEVVFTPSTIARELKFLASHTVHHFAIIAMILRLQNYEIPEDFGVAPSTLLYHQTLKS